MSREFKIGDAVSLRDGSIGRIIGFEGSELVVELIAYTFINVEDAEPRDTITITVSRSDVR